MLQVLTFGTVVGQIDRAVVSGYGFLAAPELVEQVCASGPGGLKAACVLVGIVEEGVERGEAGRGALDLGGDGGGTKRPSPSSRAATRDAESWTRAASPCASGSPGAHVVSTSARCSASDGS